jgi:uncharacterized BrkB/YihY/UPF0761 family membrane protein
MHPEFRRPPVGPHRSTWPYRFAELFFATIAKATMVIAVLLLVALEFFSGGMGTGGGLSDLPTTGRGWRNLLLVMLTILVVVALGIYFFAPTVSHPHL